jgi:hypothetical protein
LQELGQRLQAMLQGLANEPSKTLEN